MNTNQKGHIGLACVLKDLAQRGYETFLPPHDYSCIDLIVIDSKAITKRLQVKYREPKHGTLSVRIPLYSVVNGIKMFIDQSKIDGWALYCPTNDKLFYVPISAAKANKFEFGFPIYTTDYSDPALFWITPQ